jgi:hypothetical protein
VKTLSSQFKQAITNITVNGAKRARAIKAHTEIRALLETDSYLCGLGIDTVLIGSYARQTGIYPGHDVDVFVKLKKLDTSADPQAVFDAVCRVLVAHYGDRVEIQHRSVKVSFDGDDKFSVDAVPAVRFGERWALPTHDRDLWQRPGERWIETDPERLGELTSMRNRTPTVEGDGAYVPTVKLVRQIRANHLGDQKPGGLYCELACYWAFEAGIGGTSYAEVLAGALRSIAGQLSSGAVLLDPVLGRAFEPTPDSAELSAAAVKFDGLASQAEGALSMQRCPAAAIWRRILGTNDRGACFPLPAGCDESGREITRVSPVIAQGAGAAGGFG